MPHAASTSLFVLLALLLVPAIAQARQAVQQNPRVLDSPFVITGIALIGATVYDLETTFLALEKCPSRLRCYEGNPVQRPFIERGRPAAYAANMAVDAGLLYGAYQMKKSQRFRCLWWALPAAGIAGHAVGGTMNLRLVLSWK